MDLHTKLTILDKIYAIYAQFTETLPIFCTKGCATCCTRNVILTTLEGRYIINHLSAVSKINYLETLFKDRHKSRFQPEITLNGMAQLLLEGKEAPSEDASLEGKCPLLNGDVCTIYPARPFGCRCFLSRTDCSKTGAADVDPFIVTVNNVFLQFIEHIDAKGSTGNLTDVLLFLDGNPHFDSQDQPFPGQQPEALVQNRPIPLLLVPPEHQEKIGNILSQLNAIRVPLL